MTAHSVKVKISSMDTTMRLKIERSQDNNGVPMMMEGFAAMFLGLAVGPVTAIVVGASGVIASV